MRWMGWLGVVLGLAGCFDEAKQACQIHADCAGVRQCVSGVCMTPAAFGGDAFAPRYSDDAGGEEDVGDAEPSPGEGIYVRIVSGNEEEEARLGFDSWILEGVVTSDPAALTAELLIQRRMESWNPSFIAESPREWAALTAIPPGSTLIFEDVEGEGVVLRWEPPVEAEGGVRLRPLSPSPEVEASLAARTWELREAVAVDQDTLLVELVLVVGDGTLSRFVLRAYEAAGWEQVAALPPGRALTFEDPAGEGVLLRWEQEAAP